jgi:diacylglycerol kinase (ATP)
MLGCPTPLGLVPAGTNNNIAAVLGLPINLYEAAEVALSGQAGWISAGRIKDFVFFEGAGIGLEADLWQIGEAIVRRQFGEILRAPVPLARDRAADLEIELDTQPAPLKVRALTLTISNSRMTGAHLVFAPEADMRKPGLLMTVYHHLNRVRLLRALPLLADGKPGRGYRTARYKFMRALIRAAEPLHVHADGTLIGGLPVEVESIPNAVLVSLPRSASGAGAVA